MKNKNTIRLTESDLKNMIAEAAKQALNELSPEFVAGAYKRAKDLDYEATSPMERNKRQAQADRFNKAAVDKYNARYGTKDKIEGGHRMTSLYYSPYTKAANARTETTDGAGTKQYIDYTSENPNGVTDTQYSTGRITPKSPQLANRAARGEKVITKALTDLNNSNKPTVESIKISEANLNKLINESINDILKQLNEGAGWGCA